MILFQGPRNALISVGCGSATLAPVAAGYLFTRVGPMSIWWLNVAIVGVQAACAVYLVVVFRGLRVAGAEKSSTLKNVEYKKLSQHDDDDVVNMVEVDLEDSEEGGLVTS